MAKGSSTSGILGSKETWLHGEQCSVRDLSKYVDNQNRACLPEKHMMFFYYYCILAEEHFDLDVFGQSCQTQPSCCPKTFDLLEVKVYKMEMAHWTQERALARVLREALVTACLLALPDMPVLTSHPGHGNCP